MYWKAAAAALLLAASAVHAHAQALAGEARQLHDSILKSRDHHGRPFAIVDKKGARIFVFDGAGHLHGSTPVLLGQANGDDSAPEVGEHTQQGFVPLHERTTPAGRFVSEPGVNASGEAVIWVDYNAAFAIHRVRPGRAEAARKVRLASKEPSLRRVSYGCVVVPVRFYEDVVQRWLGKGRSIVYVMPERESFQEVFSSL
jgi:hypothetical protein